MKSAEIVILFVFCLIFSLFTSAQNEVIISIRDTSEIQKLILKADSMQASDPSKAFILVIKAESMADKLDRSKELSYAAFLKGRIYARIGKYAEAIESYQISLNLSIDN